MWRSRVSPVADVRWAGAPAASRPATHGLACAAQTPAIPKEPEESGPTILIGCRLATRTAARDRTRCESSSAPAAWRSGTVV